MTKQEFLAMSLPYGLKFKTKTDGNIEQLSGVDIYNVANWTNPQYPNGTICLYSSIDYSSMWSTDEAELILHPLSDLTKEIEHKGEKFVPSYKLGVDRGFEFYKPSNFDLEINFETPNYSTQIDLFTGFLIVQKLIEWHFDIADLISKGEAIDVNTLDINPYK